MSKRLIKICVVTGSRAEYGLLKPLLLLIQKEKKFILQLMVTGMHLSPEFGLTYEDIEKDGFKIQEKIEMLISGDTDAATTKSMGVGLLSFADAFARLQPDWVVVLGDRFEILAVVIAAHTFKIPVAHLHGGELTEGAVDDAYRHAITKMSYLHFTATNVYKQRVIQLGESPDRVFNTGAIGIDNLKQIPLLSKEKLESDLGFIFKSKTILATYHPTTLEKEVNETHITNLLLALENIPGLSILFTMPNADAGGRLIMQKIKDFEKKNPNTVKAITNLGQTRYLSALQYVELVAGNSSSGIIEVPYFRIPTVNIGARQNGRLKPSSVIDSDNSTEGIVLAIKKGLSKSFRDKCKTQINLYGDGNAAMNIIRILKKTEVPYSIKKTFFDLH